MVHSDRRVVRTVGEHRNEEKDALQASAPLRAQGPADHGLVERVKSALYASGHGALRSVSVSVEAGIVIIEGRVTSYYLEHVAHSAAQAVPAANQICNSLNVVRRNSNHQVGHGGRRLPIVGPQGRADLDGPRPTPPCETGLRWRTDRGLFCRSLQRRATPPTALAQVQALGNQEVGP